MMLHTRIQQAINLKKIVDAMTSINQYARLTIQDDGLFLQVMKPEHGVPVSLTLCTGWFQSYYNMSDNAVSGGSWTVVFDLHTFNSFLGLANDDDLLEIFALSADGGFNRFYFLFDRQDGELHFHEMEFQRDVEVDMAAYFNGMELSYGYGFSVAMSPHYFAHVLQHSMTYQQPLNIDITSLMVMVSSGAMMRFLEQGSYCVIENFSEGGLFSIQMSLYVADYFIKVARIAKSIFFKIANPKFNPELPPMMSVSIEQFAMLHFSFSWDSIIKPRVEHHCS